MFPDDAQTNFAVLSDPDRFLQDLSVHVAARRSQLLAKVVGKSVTTGTHRGVLAKVEQGQLHIRLEDGAMRGVALTRGRFDQLTADTMRK